MSVPKYKQYQRFGKLIFETILYVANELNDEARPSVLRTCRWVDEGKGQKIEVVIGTWKDFASFIANNMQSRGYSEKDFSEGGEFFNYSSQFLKGLVYLQEMGLVIFHNEKEVKESRGQAEKKFDIIKFPDLPRNLDGYLLFFDEQHEIHQKLKKIEKVSPKVLREPRNFDVPYSRNRYFTGRKEILEQLHEQLKQQQAVAITQVEAISGLGGIGKTQTAVEYAFRHYYDERTYEYIFWVRAGTETNISINFAALADQLALPVGKGTLDEKILVMQAWLANHDGWLLIFDNADTPSLLEPWIPNNPAGKILITSRASVFLEIGISSSFALEPMSTEEGTEMLFRRTEYKETESERSAAAELNDELGGLPLALEQASAYMRRQRMSIQEYLNFYRKRGFSGALKKKAKPKNYPESVFRTWELNFEAVKRENLSSSELLHFSSFLAPDDIPYRILTHGASYLSGKLANAFKDKDEEDTLFTLKELLEPLSQYSLITWEYDRPCYSVHRLVQTVVRDQIQKTKSVHWVERAIETIEIAYPGEAVEHWSMCSQFLPHWAQISEHAERFDIRSIILANMFHHAQLYLQEQGRYSEAEPFCQKDIETRQRLLGHDHPETANSINSLGVLRVAQSRYGEAESILNQAVAMLTFSGLSAAGPLTTLGEMYRQQGNYAMAEVYLQGALEHNREYLQETNYEALAINLNNLGLLYNEQERYDNAQPLFEEALKIMRQFSSGEGHPRIAQILNNLGNLYLALGNLEESQKLHLEALTTRSKLLGHDHPDTVQSMQNLAILFNRKRLFAEALPLYIDVVETTKKSYGRIHPTVPHGLIGMAKIYCEQGIYAKAEELYQEALEIRQILFGTAHPETAIILLHLGHLYRRQGRYADSLPLFHKALEIKKQIFGDVHQTLISTYTDLVFIYSQLKRNDETETIRKELRTLLQCLFGSEYSDIVNGITKHIESCLKDNGINEAIVLLLESLVVGKELFGDTHPDLIQSYVSLSSLYYQIKSYKDAEFWSRELLEMLKRLYGNNHPDVANLLQNLAVLYCEQNRYDEAVLAFEDALKACKKSLGNTHPGLLDIYARLGDLYTQLGRYDEAEKIYQSSLPLSENLFGDQGLTTLIRATLEKIQVQKSSNA